jgi:hypothetical protein
VQYETVVQTKDWNNPLTNRTHCFSNPLWMTYPVSQRVFSSRTLDTKRAFFGHALSASRLTAISIGSSWDIPRHGMFFDVLHYNRKKALFVMNFA